MKRQVILLLITFGSLSAMAQNRFWVATSASNWNNPANWSAASGGAGGATVPTVGNLAIFNGVVGTGACQLDIAPTVTGITVNGYSGTIDLKGFALTTTGVNTFASGTITNSGAAASVTLSAAGATTFSGTTFGTGVTGSAGNILFNGSTFGGVVTLTKTNNTNDTGAGNNTFNGNVTLTNSSTSQWLLGNANKDIFNKPLTLNVNNTGAISVASGGATTHQLNDNVTINYNSTGTVNFGLNNGPSSLALGKTLTIGSFGAGGCGNLNLGHFTASTTAQALTLAGNTTATLTVGPSSSFAGNLTVIAPSMIFNTSTFSGTTSYTKTGTVDDNERGGNLFSGTVTITNQSDNDILFGHIAADAGDTFNGNSTFNDLGGGRIRIPENSSGTVFNAPATFNSNGANNLNNRIQISRFAGSSATFNNNTVFNNTGNSSDIEISYDPGSLTTFNGPVTFTSATSASGAFYVAFDGAVVINNNVTVNSTCGDNLQFGADTGTATLSNGFSVSVGAGFSLGQLSFLLYTQAGSTAQNLTLTGTATLQLGPTAVFGGNVNFVAPQVLLNGSTFNGTAYIEKSGATNNTSAGGNTFSSTTTLVDSGAGQLILSNTSPDTFNGDLTVTNSGTGTIMLANNVAGTAFNGNITVSSSAGGGIYFGNNATGSSTQAAGKNISIGTGFSSGELRFRRFTQNGPSPDINLTLTGISIFRAGPSTTFSSNVHVVAPQVYLDGAAYNGGTTYIEKNGATNNSGNGGNTFAGTTTLVDSGSGQLLTANTSPDTFNGNLTVTNTGTNNIRLADNIPGTVFNGNITLNATSGTGIVFSNNAIGNSSQAAGQTLSIGAFGFSSGNLQILRFTQNGSTAVGLTLTAASTLTIGPATTFGGNVTFVAPQIFLNGGTFNGTAYIEKNGATNNTSNGGNTFMSTTSLVDSGSGQLLMANTSPDTFNGDLTVTNTGSSNIRLADNVPGTAFNGNITVNATSGTGIVFSNNAAGNSSQATGGTIFVGASGFSAGTLQFSRFTQNGTTPVSLTLTSSAILLIGPTTSFGGNVTFVAPQVFLNGGTFNGTAYIEKSGAANNTSNGGNFFSSTASLVDSGSGQFLMANSSPDTFTGDLTITNSGSNIVYIAHNVPGTTYGGNIIVNATAGGGIYFSNNATGSSTQAAGGTILVGGLGFSVGELRIKGFTQNGSTAINLTLTGVAILRAALGTSFGGNVNFIAPQIYLDGATYNGTATIQKAGATDNAGIGGNTFNSTTSLTDTGSGYLMTGNTTADTFNGDLTITNSGSNIVYLAQGSAGNLFNGNIIVNATSGNGIYFSNLAAATSTLATGKTISIGGSNFLSGELRLARFTQLGNATPISMTLGNTSSLRIGPASTFNSNVNFVSPQLFLDGCTYNGTAYLEKNGATANQGLGNNTFGSTATIVASGSANLRTNGNNTFNGTTTLTNSGSGDLLLELTNASTYNGDVIMTNTGTSNVRAAFIGANAFNGNIFVNSTSTLGVYFCENVAGTATLAAGGGIFTGAIGFSSGTLLLQRFTQLGNGAQTLTLTGNSILQIGPTSTFNGNVNFKAPQVLLNGCTYNGTTSIEKTGATNNDSNGNNIFNGVTSLTNSGSGWLRMARTALDQFNNDLTLTNTGISAIYMSDLIAGSQYNGNIIVNCTLGIGVYFGNNNGSSTLASGMAVSVGASGFTTGELRLQNFTQLGNANQTATLTGNADIRVGPNSIFNGNVSFVAPQVYLDGATYNGTAYLEKNGAGSNQGLGNNTFATNATIVNSGSGQFRTNGNNVFNGPTALTNSGSNDLLLELTAGSTYNGDVTMTNSGSSNIRTSFTGSNFFNGNIIVNSLTATGVFFCENAAGTAILATGKTISVGALGFSAGQLLLQRFTQVGPTAQTLALTGAANFTSGPAATWNGAVTVTSPIVFLNGTVFNGTGNSITKTGTSTDASNGGNTYNGSVTLANGGTGIFRLSAAADTYNASATFVQSSGTIQPAYQGTSLFSGDITVNSASVITFGVNAGVVSFSGTLNEGINKTGAASPTFNRLTMNKSGGVVTLNTPINIGTTATFTTGVMSSSAANFINFASGSTTTGASNASYVDGPVQKTGNAAFTFPVGNSGIYRSIAISAPGVNTDAFTAQYFKAAQAFGGPATYAPTLVEVSSCEYWTLNRTTGASNVNVTLSWNSPDCSGTYITNLPTLRVARWSGAQWVNQGNGGTTGTTTTGTVVSTPAVTSFGPFALASTSLANPLPIELTSFTAEPLTGAVQLNWVTASELNNDHFTVERSTDGAEFMDIATIKGAGTTSSESNYEYIDNNPGSDVLYYRLQQTDFNGKSTPSGVVRVVMGEVNSLIGFPNPVQPGGTVTFNYTGYYQVYNMLGIIVLTSGSTNKINASLSPGVYIVRTDKGLVQRLVVE